MRLIYVVVVCVLLLCVCNGSALQIFFDIEKDVFFKLYKRDNPTNFTIIHQNISQPLESFDPKIPTRICIHGYLASSGTIDQFREAYLNVGDFNFIIVDWTRGAFNVNYYVSKARIIQVADKLADLITALVERGMNVKDLSLIGHSLGAHLGGLASKKLNMTEKIGSIIGLDPASVGFTIADEKNRLDKDDADYVQIIHTDIRMYGFSAPIGHADIYSHGGGLQPGCGTYSNIPALSTIDKCSHARAYELFFESLTSDFLAIQCASYEEILKNQCTFNNVTTSMGGNILSTSNKPHGVFYIETNSKPPFALPNYNMFKKIIIKTPNDAELVGIPTNNQTLEIQKPNPPRNHTRLTEIFNSVKDIWMTSTDNKTAEIMVKKEATQASNSSKISTQSTAEQRKGLMEIFKWSNDNATSTKSTIDQDKNQQNVSSGILVQHPYQYMDVFGWSKNVPENRSSEPEQKSPKTAFIDIFNWSKEPSANHTETKFKPIKSDGKSSGFTGIFFWSNRTTNDPIVNKTTRSTRKPGFTGIFKWSSETSQNDTPKPELKAPARTFIDTFWWSKESENNKLPVTQPPNQGWMGYLDWTTGTQNNYLPERVMQKTSKHSYGSNIFNWFNYPEKKQTPEIQQDSRKKGFAGYFDWSKKSPEVKLAEPVQKPSLYRGIPKWSKETPKSNLPEKIIEKTPQKGNAGIFNWLKKTPVNNTSNSIDKTQSKNSSNSIDNGHAKSVSKFSTWFNRKNVTSKTEPVVEKFPKTKKSEELPQNMTKFGFGNIYGWFSKKKVTSEMRLEQGPEKIIEKTHQKGNADIFNWLKKAPVNNTSNSIDKTQSKNSTNSIDNGHAKSFLKFSTWFNRKNVTSKTEPVVEKFPKTNKSEELPQNMTKFGFGNIYAWFSKKNETSKMRLEREMDKNITETARQEEVKHSNRFTGMFNWLKKSNKTLTS